jgi:predicted amidophosphoribosyltransferase
MDADTARHKALPTPYIPRHMRVTYAQPMAQCPRCERDVAVEYRYCPWCAEPLRLKLVELFRGAGDDEHRGLRVSRYLEERKVRFSVWDESGTARAAVSLDDDEAARLGAFVTPSRSRAATLIEDLRALVRR